MEVNKRTLKMLRVIYWILFLSTIAFFIYSLRQPKAEAIRYSLYTLALWGICFVLNRFIRIHGGD